MIMTDIAVLNSEAMKNPREEVGESAVGLEEGVDIFHGETFGDKGDELTGEIEE